MSMSFDRMRAHLLYQGVGRRPINRYLSELADHLDDIVAEERARGVPADVALRLAHARLGRVDDLVDAMAAQPQLRSWVARAPWAVLPGTGLLVLTLAYGLIAGLVAACVHWFGVFEGGHLMPPDWLPGIADRLFMVSRLIVPTLTAWMLWFLALQRGIRPIWPLTAIMLTALVAAGMVYCADWPSTPRSWELSLGWDVSTNDGDGMSLPAYGRMVAVILLLSLVPQACAQLWHTRGESP